MGDGVGVCLTGQCGLLLLPLTRPGFPGNVPTGQMPPVLDDKSGPVTASSGQQAGEGKLRCLLDCLGGRWYPSFPSHILSSKVKLVRGGK